MIIECKRYTNPVNRDLVLALHRKTQELGAHKAMMFSTSGFQKGALEYAKKHGIALVKLADGAVTYMAKAENLPEKLPDFVPRLVCLLRPEPRAFSVLGPMRPETFREWLLAPVPTSNDAEPEDDPTPDVDAPESDKDSE